MLKFCSVAFHIGEHVTSISSNNYYKWELYKVTIDNGKNEDETS